MSLLCRSCWRSSSTTSPYGGCGGGDDNDNDNDNDDDDDDDNNNHNNNNNNNHNNNNYSVAILAQVVDIRRGFLRLGALSGAILSKRARFISCVLGVCVLVLLGRCLLQFIDGCERPCVMQRRCLSCSSWTRSLTCSLCPTAGVHGGAAVPVVVDVLVIKQRQLGSRHDASTWRFWRR